jgi:hypothetical protein
MMRRPTRSFKKRWDEEAKACRELAHKLVPCPEREALLEKARQAETASSMYRSLPSLQPPEVRQEKPRARLLWLVDKAL